MVDLVRKNSMYKNLFNGVRIVLIDTNFNR